jgi:hypothetical protein
MEMNVKKGHCRKVHRIVLTFFTAVLLWTTTGSLSTATAEEDTANRISSSFPPVSRFLETVSETSLEEFVQTGELTRFFPSPEKPIYQPETTLSSGVSATLGGVDYSVGVEALFFIDGVRVADSVYGDDRETFLLNLYNILRSVSSLQGLEYYSTSRGRMRTLFEEYWAIENPRDRDPIPDPVVGEIVPGEADTVYVHQRDLTFGSSVAGVTYRSGTDGLAMHIENVTTMFYAIFPLVGRRDMQWEILVIPVREGILFYGMCVLDVLNIKEFREKMRNSMTTRLEALYFWFSDMVMSEDGL